MRYKIKKKERGGERQTGRVKRGKRSVRGEAWGTEWKSERSCEKEREGAEKKKREEREEPGGPAERST